MKILRASIHLPIVETKDLGLYEADSNQFISNKDTYPINKQFFSFHEDNLEIKCCIGFFWNKEKDQYYVQIFIKKYKSDNQKIMITDSELFLKCSFEGFDTYYCAVSNSKLTNFYVHRKFSNSNNFVEANFEVIPFLPFKLDLNFQLIPLLYVAHSPIVPSFKYYDTEWPFSSYIRQILSSSDGTIQCPHHNNFQNKQKIDSKIDLKTIQKVDSDEFFDVANINENDLENSKKIFDVTKNVCEELGSKYRAVYGIPNPVYSKESKTVKLDSNTDFLIYALPPKYQSEIPTIISVDFADLNPFHLCSIIRKEIDDDYYFLTIYSPSFNAFYTVSDKNISSIDSKPRCYNDEYIISALYVRLNVLNLFRFFSLSPSFTPRFNLVTVYEIDKIFYLTDLCNNIEEEELKKSIPKISGIERADDLDEETEMALFPYDPNNLTFPSIPLTCASSRSILKIPIHPKIKKFQLIWLNHANFKEFSPIIVDLTNSSCIEVPQKIGITNDSYDLIHVSSNYLTIPYQKEDSLPTGPMILYRCHKIKRLKKAFSIAFGKCIASKTLNQFTQPPLYFHSEPLSVSKHLDEIKKAKGITKCNCYIRIYIDRKKILWQKLSENPTEISNYFKNHKISNHHFIQLFIELL